MLKFSICFILIFTSHLNIFKIEARKYNYECLIENNRYPYEYLYASVSRRSNQNNVFTYQPTKTDDIKKFGWSLISLFNKPDNDLFYMRNLETKEYLCTENKFERKFNVLSAFDKKRLVHTWSFEETIEKYNKLILSNECVWRFERAAPNSNVFFIWNYFYNEPLYAGTYLFKQARNKRNVYLRNKTIKTDEFKWTVTDCLILKI
jgi:hypothetical protein